MNWQGLSISSSFPTSRRPIYIHPLTLMSRKNKDTAYPEMFDGVKKVILKHNHDKILVHTVSYDLNKYLFDALSSVELNCNIFTYSTSQDKQQAVDRFLYDNPLFHQGSVLLAPSLERGIDLSEDQCRVIIVCKLPFPSLGTKQVSARLHSKGGQLWYNVKTIRSLVQMTGRGMRSADDYCESYILDKQFITLVWRRSKHLLPKWWKDALVWDAGQL